MKRMKRMLIVLLSLLLLFGSHPVYAESKPVDFAAIWETGSQWDDPQILVTAEPQYLLQSIASWNGKYIPVCDLNGNWMIADCYGNSYGKFGSLETPGYASTGHYPILFSDRFVAILYLPIETHDHYFIYNVNGKLLMGGEYDSLMKNPRVWYDYPNKKSNYLLGTDEEGNAVLLDSAGKKLVADEIGGIYNGKICYRKGDTCYASKLFGSVLFSGKYEKLDFVNDDTLICCKDGKYGLIRLDGSQVAPFLYESMENLLYRNLPYPDSHILAKKNGKVGLLDPSGKTAVPFQYESIFTISGLDGPVRVLPEYGFYVASRDGSSYIIRADDRYLYQGGRELPDTLVRILSPGRYILDGVGLVDEKGTVLKADVIDVQALGDCTLYDYPWSDDASAPYGHTYELYNGEGSLLLRFAASCVKTTETAIFADNNEGTAVWDFSGAQLAYYKGASIFLWDDSGKDYVVLSFGYENGFALLSADGKTVNYFDNYWWYRDATPFPCVQKEDKWYLVDPYGNQQLPYALDQELFSMGGTGCSCIVVDGLVGFIRLKLSGESSFEDVKTSAWYHESAEFCRTAGLMNGVGNGKFAPNETMTRAMLVQVLYNLSGSQCESHGFTDVPEKAWYADAVNWAAANGIVLGVSETEFGPNRPVTREQTMTILQRYAAAFTDVTGDETALDGFEDASKVSGYAIDPMRWAVSKGLIQGVTDTQLSPQGKTTRAQIATILMRFVGWMANAA